MAELNKLPPELRAAIVLRLIDFWKHDEEVPFESLAPYASVSREWQALIERHTFSELRLTFERLSDFADFARNTRRGCLKRIHLHVDLPAYFNDPCEEKEGWEDKMANNTIFTLSFQALFTILNDWTDDEVCAGGINLFFSISSKCDLRNASFGLWQRRRWNVRDIGEKRFADSYIDFIGQDDEMKRMDMLLPVHAISSFDTCPLNRRAIMPAAYSDIIAKLPRLQTVSFDLIKERRRDMRRTIFDQMAYFVPLAPELGELTTRWSPTIESLSISANTLSSWRQLPHEQLSEGNTGEKLCQQLRTFASQLKYLNVQNLVRIREFLRPVWPKDREDKDAFIPNPDIPEFGRLETVILSYGSIWFNTEWFKQGDDINEHSDTVDFRQNISLGAARLAYNMPKLRRMVISQRPMMWAGKHQLEYEVEEEAAIVTWTSTFEFKPWERTVEAWTVVAEKNAGLKLRANIETIDGWQTDGKAPQVPALAF